MGRLRRLAAARGAALNLPPPKSWDADAAALVAAATDSLVRELGEILVSVVVHGSLAMGCYAAPKADVDMLVVVSRSLTADEKRRIHEALAVAHDARGSGAGLELSVVTGAAAQQAAHPMPFELHFSFGEGSDGGIDGDLAAHITVARARGVALIGPAPTEVFAPVAWSHYIDALETDIAWAMADGRLETNTVYFVLNACRVLQIDALGEGTVMSKAEGAEWAMSSLPAQYRGMIAEALRHYLSDEAEGTARLDGDAVLKLAEFVRCRTSRSTIA